MKKNFILCFISLILGVILLMSPLNSIAEIAVPYASPVFSSGGVSISTSIATTFLASTNKICDSIYVSSCTLQRKNSNGMWVFDATLPPPSYVAYDESEYFAYTSYASYCTTGNTYRIKAVFYAEGYTITRYSNAVDY